MLVTRVPPFGRRAAVGLSVVAVAAGALAVVVPRVVHADSAAPAHVTTPARVGPRGPDRPFPRTFNLFSCSGDPHAAARDVVIGYAYCDIRAMRRANPKGLFILNAGLSPQATNRDGGNPYLGLAVTYGNEDVWRGGCDTFKGGANLGCIRAFNPSVDFLFDADGARATINGQPDGNHGWNLADPNHNGTPELIAKIMAYAAKLDGMYTKGWDGIWSDNWIYGVIGKDYAYGPNLDTDQNGEVDDYAVMRRNWDNGLNTVGELLQKYLPGKTVGGNGNWYAAVPGRYFASDPTGWLKSANITMVERIQQFYDEPDELVQIARRWLDFADSDSKPRYLLFYQDALDSSGDDLHVPTGTDPNTARAMLDPSVMRSMRWGLTLSLVCGASYEIVLDGNAGTHWWYDEYDGGAGVRHRNYLGRPSEHAVRVVKGVWERRFEHGLAISNSSASAVKIRLGQAYRHIRGTQDRKLNDGRLTRSVTVPSHDGVILLATGDRAPR